MTFATSNASGTKFTISLAPTRKHDGSIDTGHTIDRFRKLMGADVVFAIVEDKTHG